VSVRILEQLATGEQIGSIRMGVTADGVFTYEVEGGRRTVPAVETVGSVQIEGDEELDDAIGAATDESSEAPSAFSGPIPPLTTPANEQPLQA
jgi:hypothetical protein